MVVGNRRTTIQRQRQVAIMNRHEIAIAAFVFAEMFTLLWLITTFLHIPWT